MSIPNTTTFNLLDVKIQIEGDGGGVSNSLLDAFTNSNQAHFDPSFEDSPIPNSLLSFRNYGAGAGPIPDCSEWVFLGNGPFPSGVVLKITYVDCNNVIQEIETAISQNQSGIPFCVKNIISVDMGNFQYSGPQLPGGEYISDIGTLSGGTTEGCVSTPPLCYDWVLDGGTLLTGQAYEIHWTDCDGNFQEILSNTNTTWLICAKEILYFNFGGSGVNNMYDSVYDGELAPGVYNGLYATLSGGINSCE